MNTNILLSTSLTLIALLIIGTILCLPLFKWDVRKLLRSSLFTKILWWIPIYVVLVALLYLKGPFALFLLLSVGVFAIREYRANTKKANRKLPSIYLGFFLIATATIPALFVFFSDVIAVRLVLTICFASILSDVFAFFFGNYLPKHPLPRWINPGKSWEGVAGQIVGAFAGAFLLTLATGIHASLILILIIGIASAAGDLFNSIVKRHLDIKDWGKTIPGHGGVLDRLSSLSTAFFVSFAVLLIGVLITR